MDTNSGVCTGCQHKGYIFADWADAEVHYGQPFTQHHSINTWKCVYASKSLHDGHYSCTVYVNQLISSVLKKDTHCMVGTTDAMNFKKRTR